MKRKLIFMFLISIMMVAGYSCVQQQAQPAPQPTPTGSHVLSVGKKLMAGQKMYSQNGNYYLILQSDGNLVLYRKDGKVMWNSKKSAKSPGYVTMQSDGNLVSYDKFDTPIWSSGTNGWNGAYAILQNDGNLVVRNTKGQPVWSAFHNR